MDIHANEQIVSQPVVFFLGDGSSVPLGMPTTLSFRRVLLGKSNRSEKRLINALYSSAAYRYRIPEDSINLEEFQEFLHELRLGLWILARSNLPETVNPTLAAVPLDSFLETDRQINSVRWKVLETLHEVCGDCSSQ